MLYDGDSATLQTTKKSNLEIQLPTRADVAATSRPKKAIMAEVKKREMAKAGQVYNLTKQESTLPTYINWKSPAFWPLIDQAAKRQVGKPNHSALIKQLQQQDPRFNHLSHRRIGEWRDPSVKDKIVWSKKTLDEVRAGFLPGGIQTRFDVFVSTVLQSVIY
jgi:hypothetical protein